MFDTVEHKVYAICETKQQALKLLDDLNGFATPRPTWDEAWMQVAEVFGPRSLCDRRKVGAVIVTQSNEMAALSYNGPAAGDPISEDPGAGPRPCMEWCRHAQLIGNAQPTPGTTYGSCPSIHAEANALLRADRSRIVGGTVYVTSSVCMDCAKLIANSGLSRVVMRVLANDYHREPDEVIMYLNRCGIDVTAIKE